MNKISYLLALLVVTALPVWAQRTRRTDTPEVAGQRAQVFFAVQLYGPKGATQATLEPIAAWRAGNLETTISGDTDPEQINAFGRLYYARGTKYRLVFGGGDAGSATIKQATPDSDCARTNADAALQTKVQLNQLVLALATNTAVRLPASTRRRPTAAERATVITPVKAELQRQGVSATLLKSLGFVNLTALDLDRDRKAEMVGSALVEGRNGVKHLLFFIAENRRGKYALAYSNYTVITKESALSGDTSAVKTGLLNELLLDIYDIDGDGVSEVFTITKSFEGTTFIIHQRQAGQWAKWFETSNYHCAY
jgi:hypothetical protein